jgi:hypothetical protein
MVAMNEETYATVADALSNPAKLDGLCAACQELPDWADRVEVVLLKKMGVQ